MEGKTGNALAKAYMDQTVNDIQKCGNDVLSAFFHNDSVKIMSANTLGIIRKFPILLREKHYDEMYSIKFSDDCSRLLYITSSIKVDGPVEFNQIIIQDAQSGNYISDIAFDHGKVTSAFFLNNNEVAVIHNGETSSEMYDKIMKIWNLQSGKIDSLFEYGTPCASIGDIYSYTEDKNYFLSGSNVLDFNTGEIIAKLQPESCFQHFFNRDGSRVFSNTDTTFTIWDINNEDVVYSYNINNKKIYTDLVNKDIYRITASDNKELIVSQYTIDVLIKWNSDRITGVNESENFSIETGFKAYPNPFQNELNISSETAPIRIEEISLHNIFGKTLLKISNEDIIISNDKWTMKTSHLPREFIILG